MSFTEHIAGRVSDFFRRERYHRLVRSTRCRCKALPFVFCTKHFEQDRILPFHLNDSRFQIEKGMRQIPELRVDFRGWLKEDQVDDQKGLNQENQSDCLENSMTYLVPFRTRFFFDVFHYDLDGRFDLVPNHFVKTGRVFLHKT